jgi:DNA replication and repair protein RecF
MITSIRLQNFRSYGDESFEFEPGVNIVVGPNASGKTNLLEAALVLARGSSYRARDAELVKIGKKWARLDGFFDNQTRSLKLQATDGRLAKTFMLNNKPYKRLSLEKYVPFVFFEPNHLQLLTRGPEGRRDYIDDLLSRSLPGFKTLNASYRRTLAQRNALLKQGQSRAAGQLFAWNIRLSELGGKIALGRQELVNSINKNISRSYSEISQHKSKVVVEYQSHFPLDRYGTRLLSKLEDSTVKDFRLGFTAYGPHREDVVFYLNKQPVGLTASRGESRSLLLALKMFELATLEKVYNQKPVLLLDDVFSELDGARRRALVSHLDQHQTIITTTDADAVMEYFATGNQKILPIKSSS